MKTFPPTLNTILDRSPFNAARLCAEAGLSEGNFSRIRSGNKEVTHEILTKLITCDLIPLEDRNLLLLSYLRDEVPPGFANNISITLLENHLTAAESIDPLREAIEWLYQRSLTCPLTMSHITGLYKMLTVSG